MPQIASCVQANRSRAVGQFDVRRVYFAKCVDAFRHSSCREQRLGLESILLNADARPHVFSASAAISENSAIPENIWSSFPSSRRRFSRTTGPLPSRAPYRKRYRRMAGASRFPPAPTDSRQFSQGLCVTVESEIGAVKLALGIFPLKALINLPSGPNRSGSPTSDKMFLIRFAATHRASRFSLPRKLWSACARRNAS